MAHTHTADNQRRIPDELDQLHVLPRAQRERLRELTATEDAGEYAAELRKPELDMGED